LRTLNDIMMLLRHVVRENVVLPPHPWLTVSYPFPQFTSAIPTGRQLIVKVAHVDLQWIWQVGCGPFVEARVCVCVCLRRCGMGLGYQVVAIGRGAFGSVQFKQRRRMWMWGGVGVQTCGKAGYVVFFSRCSKENTRSGNAHFQPEYEVI
jgi:hypothetical protein